MGYFVKIETPPPMFRLLADGSIMFVYVASARHVNIEFFFDGRFTPNPTPNPVRFELDPPPELRVKMKFGRTYHCCALRSD